MPRRGGNTRKEKGRHPLTEGALARGADSFRKGYPPKRLCEQRRFLGGMNPHDLGEITARHVKVLERLRVRGKL